MAFTPVSGDIAKVTVGAIDQPGVNWKLDIDGNEKDASNFRDGRNVKTTLVNVTATFTLVWDSFLEPTISGGGLLIPGTTATIKFYTDAAKFFSGSFTVTKIGPENKGPEDLMMMDVTAKINGVLTYPL